MSRDSHAEHELELYAMNERAIYPQYLSIAKNLINKIASGKYDAKLAERAWLHFVDSASTMYRRDFGSAGGAGKHAFTMPVRRAVAASVARYFETEAALGNYASLLHKKYQPKRPKLRLVRERRTRS